MSQEEGSKTVVLGGRNDVQQQYCGTVGGQSTDFSTIDTEVKVREWDQLSSNLTDVELIRQLNSRIVLLHHQTCEMTLYMTRSFV